MLHESIRSLILDEQARQKNRFIEGVDFEQYLAKLDDRAEILSSSAGGRCRGFVAFYSNDQATKQAYITLVVVDPRDRGKGLGRALIECVLNLARQRGCTSCRLEVSKANQAAYDMYTSTGFHMVEDRGHKHLLEIAL